MSFSVKSYVTHPSRFYIKLIRSMQCWALCSIFHFWVMTQGSIVKGLVRRASQLKAVLKWQTGRYTHQKHNEGDLTRVNGFDVTTLKTGSKTFLDLALHLFPIILPWMTIFLFSQFGLFRLCIECTEHKFKISKY